MRAPNAGMHKGEHTLDARACASGNEAMTRRRARMSSRKRTHITGSYVDVLRGRELNPAIRQAEGRATVLHLCEAALSARSPQIDRLRKRCPSPVSS